MKYAFGKFGKWEIMFLIISVIAAFTACNNKTNSKSSGGGKANSRHTLEVFSAVAEPYRSHVEAGMQGVDLKELSAPQKELALKILNEVPCDCGCRKTTVAECRVSVTDCAEGGQQATKILTLAKGGKTEAEIIRGLYAESLSRMLRGNAQPLLDGIGGDKEKEFMVAHLAKTVAGLDVSTLKNTGDELTDARAAAKLFIGKEKSKLLTYLEGSPDELYMIHGITWELIPNHMRALFEYYLFRYRPELQSKVFQYFNPGTPEQDMIMGMVSDVFGQEPLPSGFETIAGTSPWRGAEDAPVVIVEYSDFQCPYSRRVQTVLDAVIAEYPGQVKHVYKNFPLSFHVNARNAAQAALAAGKQGKFWEMHKKIFENQTMLSPEKLDELAKGIGLDMNRFKSDLSSAEIAQAVQADMDEGLRVGVSSTPTIIVNGVMMQGAGSVCIFKEIIEDALKNK